MSRLRGIFSRRTGPRIAPCSAKRSTRRSARPCAREASSADCVNSWRAATPTRLSRTCRRSSPKLPRLALPGPRKAGCATNVSGPMAWARCWPIASRSSRCSSISCATPWRLWFRVAAAPSRSGRRNPPKTSTSSWRMTGPGSTPRSPAGCSVPSIQPSGQAWGLAFPFAGRSSKPMAAASGQCLVMAGVPNSISRCPAQSWETPMSHRQMIHIIDDEEAVRHSLAIMLQVAGYAVTAWPGGASFLREAAHVEPGCVLLDIRMPEMDGLEVQRTMQEHGIAWPVVVLTGHGDVTTAVAAMKAGAIDFLEKPLAKSTLVTAIEAALQSFEGTDAARRRAALASQRIARLTAREQEVLRGLANGLPNRNIAHELAISPRTVEIHRANLMAKLGVRTLSDALRLAFSAGLDSPVN